jgi:hypothetical protein
LGVSEEKCFIKLPALIAELCWNTCHLNPFNNKILRLFRNSSVAFWSGALVVFRLFLMNDSC